MLPGELKQWRPPEFPSGGSEVKTSLRLEDDLGRQLERTRATELTGDLLYIDD
jgi:hypothetical protein